MVNAWGLLGSILNGTLDEDYPIMTQDNVGVRTDQDFWEEDGHSVVGNPMAAPAADDTITFDNENFVGAADTVPLEITGGKDALSFTTAEEASDWVKDHGGYEWTPGSPWPGNDEPAPFPDDPLSDNDDQIAHHIPTTPEVFGNQYTTEQLENDRKYQESMMPGINEEHRKWIYESPDGGKTVYRRTHGQDPMTRELVPQKDSNTGVRNERPDGDFARVFYKYKEDVMLDEAKNYIATTYGSHYTSNDGIQTLDLIQGIGDAEAFCRSNAIKYLSRFGKKDGKSKVDILKAIHYCTLLYHFAGLHDEN